MTLSKRKWHRRGPIWWEYCALNDSEATEPAVVELDPHWGPFRLVPVCTECDWRGLHDYRGEYPVCPDCGAETEEVAGRYKTICRLPGLNESGIEYVDFERRKVAP